ncbi:MAG: T9SS type A sorting domain-containing protein, partial [Bacteroidales bacterium]|nr:T9SS type A sorting domain-containing protein [Bacteroidales bacterium]
EEEDNGINIYPNPTDGELTIEISDYRGEVQVSVIDNSGKLCAILSKLLTKSERKIFLDLESYPAGVYFIVVKKQGTFYTEKVVIR